MGRHYSYVLERRGPAAAEVMFELIRDAEAWREWAGLPVRYSGWRDGAGTDDGSLVGRVRVVGMGRFRAAEQVTDDDRPRLHGYRVLASWPVRDYRARVQFLPHDDGTTTVRWSGEFSDRIPGSGRLYRWFVRGLLGRFADNLLSVASASMGGDDDRKQVL